MRYYFSPHITYARFVRVNKKIEKIASPNGTGITAVGLNKMLWELLRDRRINIFIDTTDTQDPIALTLKNIPKGARRIQ